MGEYRIDRKPDPDKRTDCSNAVNTEQTRQDKTHGGGDAADAGTAGRAK